MTIQVVEVRQNPARPLARPVHSISAESQASRTVTFAGKAAIVDQAHEPRPDTNDPASDAVWQSKEGYLSEELLGDRKEILIYHHGEIYRLRLTRQNKLILCK